MNDTLLYEERSDGVASITLNRPDVRNAFDDQLIQKLIKAFNTAKNAPTVRVILLAANGKHFSAGADLNWMRGMANADLNTNLADAKQLATLMATLNELPKPVVTKVNGSAFGGAVGLIACSDIVIAADNARFALTEVKLGLSPATISPYVIAAIGQRAARRLFLTGETINTDQAGNIGLISETCALDDLDTTTNAIIQQLLQNGPEALMKTKQLIGTVAASLVDDTLRDYTCELIAELRVSEEGQEGLSAFFEKRPPSWRENNEGIISSTTQTKCD